MHSGVASVQQPLRLARVPMVQSAQAVFTDFKANNFAYLQNVYRYYMYIYMYPPFLILKVRHPAVTGVYCIVRDSRSGCSNDFKCIYLRMCLPSLRCHKCNFRVLYKIFQLGGKDVRYPDGWRATPPGY